MVRIERASANSAGFIAIVQAVDGAASNPAIGVRAIEAGESLDLEVALERAAGGNSQVTIKSVVTSTAGLIVIQPPVSIAHPLIYGVAPVALGLNAMVDVALTATTTAPAPTETLEAAIHEDVDVDGAFDLPLLIEGDRVQAEFTREAITTQ